MDAILKKLLTQDVTQDGHPLFANAAKLGEAIVKLAGEHYQNPKTTAALVSFIFRGERPCSDGLRTAVIGAAQMRLARMPKRVQDDWIQRIGRAVELQNSQVATAQEQESRTDEEQFADLLQRAEDAADHFIITPLTAEQEKGVKRAEALNEVLMRRLGISPQSNEIPQTVYRFLVPKEHTAQEFWRKLRDRTALETAHTWAEQRLKWLDVNNKLQVYVVPSFVCGCPIVAYDAETTRDAAAFSFSHHRNNVVDTIRWDAVTMREWQEGVFNAFVPLNNKEEIKRYMQDHQDFFGSTPVKFCGYRYHFLDAINQP